MDLARLHEPGELRVCYAQHESGYYICSVGSDGKLCIANGDNLELITSAKNPDGGITCICFSQKLSLLVYGDKLGGVKVCAR